MLHNNVEFQGTLMSGQYSAVLACEELIVNKPSTIEITVTKVRDFYKTLTQNHTKDLRRFAKCKDTIL